MFEKNKVQQRRQTFKNVGIEKQRKHFIYINKLYT